MAKYALLFLVVLVVIQLTLAASRHARDIGTPAVTEDPLKAFGEIFESAKKSIGDAFTKENIDGVLSNLAAFGDKAKQLGTDLVERIEKSTKEAAEKAQ